jgi:hypothetical protein
VKKIYLLLPVFYFALICTTIAQTNAATPKKKAPMTRNNIDKVKGDKDDCLAMVGYFANPEIKKDIFVRLYDGSTVVDSASVNPLRDFGFILKRNKHYSVQISTPLYYNRFFTINTELSETVKTPPLFIFEFEITLIHEMKGVDDFFLDFPIASISYDRKIKKFSFNQKYTDSMQKEVKKAEGQFKIRKSK